MQSKGAVLALAALLCVIGSAWAEEARIPPPAADLPEYEKTVFEVRWLGFKVGEITASVNGIKKINGRDAYELEATAATNGFCSAVYPVRDRYVSYMDKEKFRTLRHEVYRREGRYKKDAITDFDLSSGKARFRNLLDGSTKTIDVPDSVQDPLSAAYYFRLIPVDIGKKVELYVYNNEQVYRLFGVADRVRTVSLPRLGKRTGFRIQPYAVLDGDIVKKGAASGYFSCDRKRVPLLVSVKGPVFTEVVGYLVSEN